MMIKSELLLPAGTFKNMEYSFAYGADAVYLGLPRYSLRARNNEFTTKNISSAVNYAHSLGKKIYIVANSIPHNSKIDTFIKDMQTTIDAAPDAFIMSDPGLIMMMKEAHPEAEIHLSVQSNVVNFASVKFWEKMGISRIILSRELSLDEISRIRQECPNIELEAFVHGALCIAYSGRCLLSGYMNYRDANQGTCTNACRWDYKVNPATTDDYGDIVSKDIIATLEEPQRKGEHMPIIEDESGTYIMNSKDLCAIEFIEKLMEIGVNSFKIEGRTKSYYYCARVAQNYRRAIDDAYAGKPFDPTLLENLYKMSNRGFTSGFFERHKPEEYQNYLHNSSQSNSERLGGLVIASECKEDLLFLEVNNKIEKGQVELMTINGNFTFKITDIYDKYMNPIDYAPGSGHQVYVKLPENIKNINPNFAILITNQTL